MPEARQPVLIFEVPKPVAAAPACRVEFFAPEGLIVAEVAAEGARDYGLIAGSEGLGCEFFLDAGGDLFGVDLSLPFDLVDVPPARLLEPVTRRVKDRARPGALSLKDCPRGAINPDAVWLGEPFGLALLSFDVLPIEPTERFIRESEATEFVEVGRGMIFGVGAETGILRLVLVEGFGERQGLFGVEFTTADHGAEFMRSLNSIHLKYFQDPEPEEFGEFAHAALARLGVTDAPPAGEGESAATALMRLVDSYRRNLEMHSDTFDTRMD